MRCDAAEAGFVVMTDQHYPGWEASVNGAATPILRANFAFRTFRVPAGRSEIVLRYRPKSIPLGFAVSGAAILVCVGLAFATRPGRAAAAA